MIAVWVFASPFRAQETNGQRDSYSDSELWFNSLSETDRREIQAALILTGNYNQILDGNFGNGTFAALVRFEEKNGFVPDGTLTAHERQALRRRSEEEIKRLNFKPYNDDRAGFTISVPHNYLGKPAPIDGGYEWKSSDDRLIVRTVRILMTNGTLAAAYKEAITAESFKGYKYRTFRPGFFIVAGSQKDVRFYLRIHSHKGYAVGFVAFWAEGQDEDLRQLIVAISNSIQLPEADSAGSYPNQDRLRPAPIEKIEQRPIPQFPKSAIQSGTGFFVSKEGHLLTNAHVVKGCIDARVRLSDGRISQTSILAVNDKADLAILKSEVTTPSAASFRSEPPLRLGTDIIIFGYPRLDLLTSTGNLVNGLISGLAGPNDNAALVQISAPVQSGNSGGAVLDKSGNVVGVVVSKTNLTASPTEIEVLQPANFAINADIAKSFLSGEKVPFTTNSSFQEKQTADIADLAKGFTAIVVCQPK